MRVMIAATSERNKVIALGTQGHLSPRCNFESTLTIRNDVLTNIRPSGNGNRIYVYTEQWKH